MSKVFITFSNTIPGKPQRWWQQFDVVIAPSEVEKKAREYSVEFKNINELILPGNVQEAWSFLNGIVGLENSKKEPLPESIIYKGYQLWWIHYDMIYYKFCLPYTKYRKLFEYLKQFSEIYLYKVDNAKLFEYFAKAENISCVNLKRSRMHFIPPGVLLTTLMSLISFVWLVFSRPKVMLWTSDRFDPPRKHDFRYTFIYEELQKKKISFVEFIRSQGSSFTVIKHAFQRKRPVVYSAGIISLLYSVAKIYPDKRTSQLIDTSVKQAKNSEEKFKMLIGTHYLHNTRGTIWSIEIMRKMLRLIGIKAAIIPAATSRNMHEFLACKLNGIPTVGIMHGAISKYYFMSDFMTGFRGSNPLSVDKYGVWSERWKEYYMRESDVYSEEQLYVSGPMRPAEKKNASPTRYFQEGGEKIKVLFVAEQLADPLEVMPFLRRLFEEKNLDVYLKFRSYEDGFEKWLERNEKELYNSVEKEKIFRGTMQEAIEKCDVVVGSHSTAVLESFLFLKPPIFFETKKWGDFFDIATSGIENIYVYTPQELVGSIKKSVHISEEEIKELQNKFFGDPYKNGGKWVVEQVEAFISSGEKRV